MKISLDVGDNDEYLFAETVYIMTNSSKYGKKFHIMKDRYHGLQGQVLDEKDFTAKFTFNSKDENLLKRFKKYLEENEPEYLL